MVDASIVSSLLVKLGDVTFREAITLYGVNDRVQSIEREMHRIQYFLKDADSKSKGDNRVQNWIKEVREVSFLIEDVIDTFLMEVGSLRNKGFFRSLGRVVRKPCVLHTLNGDIDKIEKILSDIKKSRTRYGIENLPESSSTVPHVRRTYNPETDDIDIVGVDSENIIIESLLDEQTQRRSVVSIVGIGGLGKTTLAEKVYQSEKVKRRFEVSIWLNVSQEFNTANLLKEMIKKLSIDEHEEEHFVPKIKEVLGRKRYLVVLDDIWPGGDLWNEMMKLNVFPDVNNGSRVLITSRFIEIAKAADPKSNPHELCFLNEEESMNLLFKKAFVEKNVDGSYPDDLLEPAKIFSKKCGGLPLALIVVGGLLSTKPPTRDAWYKVVGTMNWQTHGNKCMEILATSYEDLPINLKPCFIYLASFPEDWEYDVKLIIQMWVAEGFIPCDEPGTMEEIADNYVEELAQRCMIQNIKRSKIDGSLTVFRVHDLLLDLAIQEAKQKNFLTVFSKQIHFQNTSDARRATFQLGDSSWETTSFEQNKMIQYTKPNVRTLIFFGKVVPFDSQLKLLRVLMVQNFDFSAEQQSSFKNSLKGLPHLRCLILVGCDFPPKFYLPINHCPNLQTLVVQSSADIVVPMSLFSIKTLRHVKVRRLQIESRPSHLPNLLCLERGFAPADLPDLQSLETLVIWEPARIDLPNMPNLVRLGLINLTSSWKSIVAFLSKLNYLVSLDIWGDDGIPLDIIDTRSFPSYTLLRRLYLEGKWQLNDATLNIDMFPPHLTELYLRDSCIDRDPMPVLEKLQCLKVLLMANYTYMGKQMICSTGGFPQLRELTLWSLEELEEWKIEEGAMPVLNHLTIRSCKMLKMVPDLQHVPTLTALELRKMSEEFEQRVQNEDQHKIKHIPSVEIR